MFFALAIAVLAFGSLAFIPYEDDAAFYAGNIEALAGDYTLPEDWTSITCRGTGEVKCPVNEDEVKIVTIW